MEIKEGQQNDQAAASFEQSTLATSQDQPQPETETRQDRKRELSVRAIRRYVEDRVIALDPNFDDEALSEAFDKLSTREKADVLYEKLMARYTALQEIQQQGQTETGSEPAPVDPYLIEEIRTLWSDKAVQDLFVQRYVDARVDAKIFKLSEISTRWHTINATISQKQHEYESLLRRWNLQETTRPDQRSALKSQIIRAANKIDDLRQERTFVLTLQQEKDPAGNVSYTTELPKISENTDIAAHIAYEQLREYQKQYQVEKFVWTDSRHQLLSQILKQVDNGLWPLLMADAGTGKSSLANAVARRLTGFEPTEIACTSTTGETDLYLKQESTATESYYNYQAVSEAYTGYADSRQSVPSHRTGRFVRFDELLKINFDKAFSLIKSLAQKRPGDLLYEKVPRPVLAGANVIATTNPPGPRYNLPELNPAFRREFAPIQVDYFPMTASNPELYEYMLATLMDEYGHISVAKGELAPTYTDQDPKDGVITLPDGRTITKEKILVSDPTHQDHGTLYRLAHAIRAVQDAFIAFNDPSTASLNMTVNSKGELKVGTTGAEPLVLSHATFTPNDISSWMEGYSKRLLSDNPELRQAQNLTQWIQLKIQTYLSQAESEDRPKLEAIFAHFKLSQPAPDLSTAQPLTPKEIGYLSPRVPQPSLVSGPKPLDGDGISPAEDQAGTETPPTPETKTIYEATLMMLENGAKVLVNETQPLMIYPQSQLRQLAPGSSFLYENHKVVYRGVVDSSEPNPDFHELVVLRNEDGFNALYSVDEIENLGSEFWQLQELRQDLIKKQYEQQQEAYKWVGWLKSLPDGQLGFETGGKAYPMPSLEKVFLHLSDSAELTQTLRTKETQGFAQVLITPFALPLSERTALLTAKVKALGGIDTYRSDIWQQDLSTTFKYLKELDATGALTGGVTKKEMLDAPDTYQFLLDGYLISVVEEMDDIPLKSESPTPINGRTPIKCGETGLKYQETFRDDPQYTGEKPMMPDEWFSGFEQALYTKYNMPGTTISQGDQIFDTKTAAWFVDTQASGVLPYARWDAGVRRLRLYGNAPGDSRGALGPRASVRKKKA